MPALLFSLAMLGAPAQADDAVHDLPSLVAAMEALQGPIKDFRCEFNGKDVYQGEPTDEVAKNFGPGGLIQDFGGVFVQQRDGDRRVDLFTRREDLKHIQREIIIVHQREGKVETSRVENIAGAIDNLGDEPLRAERVSGATFYGELLPLDEFKEMAGTDAYEATVTDDPIDGRPMKLLTTYLAFHGKIPNILARRYWIDMARGGRVVRIDAFLQDSLASRWDIELKSFRVGDAEVWMPVAAEVKNYIWSVGREAKSEIRQAPAMVRTLRVADGTMRFNQRPAQAMFKLDHKAAAPESAPVRDLVQKFNQKIQLNRPSKARTEMMLQERLDAAEEQGRGLVAVPREGVNWWPWSVGGLGLVLAGSLTALWLQRRSR